MSRNLHTQHAGTVVLPFSAVGHAPRFRVAHFGKDLLAMRLFGLIVAFFARQGPHS